MNDVITTLARQRGILKAAIKAAEKEEGTFPEGRLRVSKARNQARYFKVLESADTTGEYLSMKDKKSIRQLAQKDYNKRFLKAARKELEGIERILKLYKKYNSEAVYDCLSKERKSLVMPYIMTDDLFAKEWQSKSYKSNPYMIENLKYDTKKGELVRSKSEAIIADMLFDLKIPYRYECQIKLLNGQTRYPDFTLLDVKTRKEIYLEHFGMLDDEEYRADSLRKLDEYRSSGIYLGKNLLFTYETADTPLDIKGIKKMLKEVMQ